MYTAKKKSDLHSFFIHSNRSEMYFGVMFTPLVCHSNIWSDIHLSFGVTITFNFSINAVKNGNRALLTGLSYRLQ